MSACTLARCEYRPIAGLDVSIDGDVWPGSDYAEHIECCPSSDGSGS